jgi:tRNA pseudouridine synthase 10
VGSEDKNSLVLGRGRPFFVEILNPKKRTFSNNTLIISESEIHARLDILDEGFPRSLTRSRTVTKILIHCSESLSEKDLKQLDSLAGSTVKLKNRFSSIEKKIYSVLVDRINRSQFYLTTIADSGLPIKQFVGGIEYANPNISMLIGSNCECISFDILDVIIQ